MRALSAPGIIELQATGARERLITLSRGYVVSRAIHVAAVMGLADHLTGVPAPVDEIARALGTDPDRLSRMMRLLAGHGVFAEPEAGRFTLSPLAELLRSDHPHSLRPQLAMVDDAWWSAVGGLSLAVTGGAGAFEQVHGRDYFAYLREDPARQRRFDEGMACGSAGADAVIAECCDVGEARTIVELGGGQGGLLVELLRRVPEAQATLFEQPDVVAGLEAADTPPPFALVAGDFFDDVPAGADVYVIRGVLHDFSDADVAVILNRCSRAMEPASRLLVIERLCLPASAGRMEAHTIDVLMMALLGGRERTEADWQKLVAGAGLAVADVVETPTDFVILDVRKPDGSS